MASSCPTLIRIKQWTIRSSLRPSDVLGQSELVLDTSVGTSEELPFQRGGSVCDLVLDGEQSETVVQPEPVSGPIGLWYPSIVFLVAEAFGVASCAADDVNRGLWVVIACGHSLVVDGGIGSFVAALRVSAAVMKAKATDAVPVHVTAEEDVHSVLHKQVLHGFLKNGHHRKSREYTRRIRTWRLAGSLIGVP